MCKDLNTLIYESTRAIDDYYFELPTADGSKKWRERHYTYELYHQMRKIWLDDCPLFISGEIDKSRHNCLKELDAGEPKPDFLIHEPGNMDNNYAVMEVKTQNAEGGGIDNDMNKLQTFRRIGYDWAIYLIFGRVLPKKLQDFTSNDIEVWWHNSSGKPAVPINLSCRNRRQHSLILRNLKRRFMCIGGAELQNPEA